MTIMHTAIVYLIYREASNVTIYPEIFFIRVQRICYLRIVVLLHENKNHILKFIDPSKRGNADHKPVELGSLLAPAEMQKYISIKGNLTKSLFFITITQLYESI